MDISPASLTNAALVAASSFINYFVFLLSTETASIGSISNFSKERFHTVVLGHLLSLNTFDHFLTRLFLPLDQFLVQLGYLVLYGSVLQARFVLHEILLGLLQLGDLLVFGLNLRFKLFYHELEFANLFLVLGRLVLILQFKVAMSFL